MAYEQLITPNPNIACKPGWCLAYVRGTYGLSADGNYPTAISNWNSSQTQHRDRNFPANCWVPVWFSLAYEPAGHVALLAPDGSVWSSSHPTSTTPTHHSSLDALIQYYAKANPLTYLGWTQDIQGITIVKEENMKITAEQVYWLYYTIAGIKLDINDPQIKGHTGGDYFAVTEEIKQYFANSGNCAFDFRSQLEANKSVKTSSVTPTDADKKLQAIRDALGIK